jgi:hypothetical protein
MKKTAASILISVLIFTLTSCKPDISDPAGPIPLTSISGKVANWTTGKKGVIQANYVNAVLEQGNIDANGNFSLNLPTAAAISDYLSPGFESYCPSAKFSPLPPLIRLSLRVLDDQNKVAGYLQHSLNPPAMTSTIESGTSVGYRYSSIDYTETGTCTDSPGVTTSVQVQGKAGWQAILTSVVVSAASKTASITIKTGTIPNDLKWYFSLGPTF